MKDQIAAARCVVVRPSHQRSWSPAHGVCDYVFGFPRRCSCQIWWPRTWLASSCSGVMPPPQHQARADPLELLWSRASCSFQVRRIHKSSLLRALAAAHSAGHDYVFPAPSMSWFACAPRSVGLLALAAIVLVRVGIDVF